MSWKSGRTVRVPIIVDKLTSGTSAIDISFTVPADHVEFWDAIDAASDDKSTIRVTDADGTTDLTWQASSFTFATRTLVVEVDNWTPPAEQVMGVIFIYAGGSDTTNEGSFTAASARTGYAWTCDVDGPIVSPYVGPAGATRPTQIIGKAAAETIMVWLDVRAVLAKRTAHYNGHPDCEELVSVDVEVLLAAADQTAMYDLTETRMTADGLVRFLLKAGTTANQYTIAPTLTTTGGRVLTPRFLLDVTTADET
jgi:hypothetical protein